MYIDKQFDLGNILIVEGIHLDATFMQQMMDKYGSTCVCIVLDIHDK